MPYLPISVRTHVYSYLSLHELLYKVIWLNKQERDAWVFVNKNIDQPKVIVIFYSERNGRKYDNYWIIETDDSKRLIHSFLQPYALKF